MDARPILEIVARSLEEQGLEAIIIGNAGAALQGAPVATVDIDFLFRATPSNIRKLKGLARTLGAVIFRPYYPASGLYRLVRDSDGLQLDFMSAIDGVRSFNSLRSRAIEIDIGEQRVTVADLADIIASKRAAARPRDRANLNVLEETLQAREKHSCEAQAGHSRANARRPKTRK